MHALPVEDATVSAGAHLRADGRLMRDFYAFRVKGPADSREPWDLYERVATIQRRKRRFRQRNQPARS